MVTANTPVLNSLPTEKSSYRCEPAFEDTQLRIKIICTSCGAVQVGNAEDVKQWQATHHCCTSDTAS